MNLVLLFILVSCGSLGFVVANLLTDELTEKIKRLEAQNQDKDAIIEGMTIERNIENLAFQVENKTMAGRKTMSMTIHNGSE